MENHGKPIMCRSFCMGNHMSFRHLWSMQQFTPVWNDAHPQQLMLYSWALRGVLGGWSRQLWSLSQMMSFQQQKRVKNGTKTARHFWGLSLCQNLGRSSCCAHGSFMTFDGATHVIFFQLLFLVVLMAFNGKIHHCFLGKSSISMGHWDIDIDMLNHHLMHDILLANSHAPGHARSPSTSRRGACKTNLGLQEDIPKYKVRDPIGCSYTLAFSSCECVYSTCNSGSTILDTCGVW